MTPQQAERLLPVLVHVQAHLDGDLSLDSLAHCAGMSARHLHRLFQAALGETPQKYVERLRIERAALCLSFQEDPVLHVALAVGYSGHEVFTRAFRRRFSLAPREYRARGRRPAGEERRRIQASSSASSLSEARLVTLPPRHVAFVRHVGRYEDVDPNRWAEISQWLRSRGIRHGGWLMGLGHDAPGITAPDRLRFDACVAVNGPFHGEGHVGCQPLAGGLHAQVTHVGPLDALPAAYAQLADRLERIRAHRPIWLPILEAYHVRRIDDVHALLQTDIHVPLESIG
jgi:AraC family transcriptional regulator